MLCVFLSVQVFVARMAPLVTMRHFGARKETGKKGQRVIWREDSRNAAEESGSSEAREQQ